MQDTWIPTSHGGFRRTRAAQIVENSEETSLEAKGEASSDVKDDGDAGEYLEGHHPDKMEVGGSNPSPRTSKFIVKFREPLGLPTCPYVIRWRVETPWFSVRLHHWLAPDDDRAKHDHPWNFMTFVIKGGYTDVSPSGEQHLKAPTFQYREATHQHTVFPDPGGAWTIVITGPKIRNWGFWVNGKFKKMNKYFLTYGHHPCN